ncbi:MAG: TerC family protein [Verrucomicrobiota bacterium]
MISVAEIVDAIPIILSLIVIEGLLSVDNALAIAAMVTHLPKKQRFLAVRLGILGAYVFRIIALLLANWIIANTWIKVLGALYLIWLMVSHIFFEAEQHDADDKKKKKKMGLWLTVIHVELMDLSLSLDNVITAVAMSPKLWVVITGVLIGIAVLRIAAGFCIGIVEKYPILKKTAFLLVGFVGGILLFEIFTGTHVGSIKKFIGIVFIVAITLAYDKIKKRWTKKGNGIPI